MSVRQIYAGILLKAIQCAGQPKLGPLQNVLARLIQADRIERRLTIDNNYKPLYSQ